MLVESDPVSDASLGEMLLPRWSEYVPPNHQPWPKQIAFCMLPHFEALYGGAAGGGKVLRKGEVILTPFGWKKCEDLKVGDRVNTPEGATARIIQLHPWTKLKGVRVSFHDGSSTIVAWDHLWLAWRSGKRKKTPNGQCVFGREAAEVIETRELAEWLNRAKEGSSRSNWPLIPVCEPQVFNVQQRYSVEIDPYQLGFWLGDGHWSTSGVGLTGADDWHILNEFGGIKSYGKYQYRFTGELGKKWKDQLTRAGLKGSKAATKFIPREFLFGSIEDRWSMLQGLMDTDGTVDERGQLYFTSISYQLIQDVCSLVQSLGGTASLFSKDPFYRDKSGEKVFGQLAYSLYIKLPEESKAFRLQRKKDRCRVGGNLYRRVVAVEEVDEIEGRCLTVSNPSGLYLTNDFIVTHNSDALLMAALQYVHVPGYSAIIFRKTLTDLQQNEGLLHRAHEWLDPYPEVRYIPSQHTFEWPNGSRLAFGYLGSITAWMGYQGAAFQYLGFDELTQHAELYYREMISRVRRVGCHLHGLRIVDGKYAPLPDDPNCYQCLMKGQLSRVPLRVRSASNPGGPGHIWVKKRFKIHKDKTSGMWVSGVGEKPFIPASYLDNPALDSESYKKSLAELDEARRAQLEEGDWDKLATGLYKHNWFRNYIYEGGYFVLLNPETGARETSFHEDRLQKFCIVDIACSVRTGVAGESFYKNTRGPSWTVLGTFGITPNDRLLVLNVRRYQEEAPNLFPAMGDMIRRWKPLFVGMDANGPGRPLFQLARERGFPVKEVMPRGSERVHFDKIANSAEMQNHCKSGRVYLPQIDFTSGDGEQPWVDDLLGELTTWTGHPWDTDDQVDVMSNAGHEFTIMAGNQYRDITIESHMNEIPALQRYTADTLFHGDIFANEGFGYEPPPLPYS